MRSIDLSTKQQVAIVFIKLLAIISVSFAIGLKAGESRWKSIAERALVTLEDSQAGWEKSQAVCDKAIDQCNQLVLEREQWMAAGAGSTAKQIYEVNVSDNWGKRPAATPE